VASWQGEAGCRERNPILPTRLGETEQALDLRNRTGNARLWRDQREPCSGFEDGLIRLLEENRRPDRRERPRGQADRTLSLEAQSGHRTAASERTQRDD